MRHLLLNIVNVMDDQRVLDVACGTGDLIAALAKRAAIEVHGVDIAEQMIAVAKAATPNLDYLASPCCPLPFHGEIALEWLRDAGGTPEGFKLLREE